MKITLKAKLIGASLIALVSMATVLTLLSTNQLYNQTFNAIQDRLDSFTYAATEDIADWLATREQIVTASLNQQGTSDNIPALIQAKEAGGFEVVYWGTNNGHIVRSDQIKAPEGYDPRQRPWYIDAAQAGKVSVSKVYTDAISNKKLVTIAEPQLRNGQVIGVMGADLLIEQLIEDVISYDVGDNAFAMMLTKEGRIIAHPDQNFTDKTINKYNGNLAIADIERSISQKNVVSVDFNGKKKLYRFAAIPSSDWVLAVELDYDTEMSTISSLLMSTILTSIAIAGVMVAVMAWLVSYLFKDLIRVSHALAEIADGEGDLTNRLEPHSDDEVGQLAKNFNTFVGNMHKMVKTLSKIAQGLSEQSQGSASRAKERSVRIQHQQDEINMVATAINEMAAATQEIAGNANNTAKTSEESVATSADGAKQVDQTRQSIGNLSDEVEQATTVIGELNQHAQNITSIISTIQDIAEQTNLLALNAAIEAARAGEQGRGFAVVADEVRVLSQRTHSSTQEIQQMIESLQGTTRSAVSIMGDSRKLAETSVDDASAAAESLNQITASVSTISDMAAQIASAAEEQSSVTTEITRNTESIRDVADELAEESHQAAHQASNLSDLAQQLQSEISRFKL